MQAEPGKIPQHKLLESDPPTELASLWEKALKKELLFNYPSGTPDLRTLLLSFARQFIDGDIPPKASISLMIRQRISTIQTQIARQLDEILHHQDFQKIEASWQGLMFLVKSSKPSSALIIRALNVSKHELILDFEKLMEFDRSALFKLVYEKEFGSFGGLPYSFLIGDYEFSRSSMDMFLLKNISHVAAAAHAPFISGVSPGLLDMGSFGELGIPRNLNRIFQSKEMIKWHAFRKLDDSRYVVLTLPRMLLRLPYGRSRERLHVGPISYEENVNGQTPEKYLWGNAAYALGQRICESFTEYGWLGRFFGIDGTGAGKVKELPLPQFDAVSLPKMSTDVYILSSVEKELSHQGFVCLCHCKMGESAAFFSAHTVHQQKTYMGKKSTENERLSSMLPHILTASRFAHYLKAITRDKIGKFTDKEDIKRYLNNWLSQYVLTQTNVTPELKASHPLQESNIEVFEDSGRPGHFKILAHLRPHYQLETLNASIRLISDLPSSKG